MKKFIENAYILKEMEGFFSDIKKEDILELYTNLDCVYDMLESLDIVCVYSKNEILKDFDVMSDRMSGNYIKVKGSDKSRVIDVRAIVGELTRMYTR
tara:strand:- start:446 stop:736 length:291 start_codon:yes stop_codon:yes gene_type:complete